MLHESSHACVSTDDGIGTLWLSPPGGRVGAGVLRQVLTAVEAVERTAGVEILVVRSGTPVGFGRGLADVSDDLPRLGQRVTAALAGLSIPTVAFVEGPCVGPALELALACDFRLAVAGPDSWVSFGDLPPGWGGRTRLRILGAKLTDRITAREAVRTGVFDHAFCERRGKIELRTWLDRLQANPRKPAPPWRGWFVDAGEGFAAERRAFRQAVQSGPGLARVPATVPPPRCVGLVGDNPLSKLLAVEFAIRGVSVVWVEGATPELFAAALRRGRVTPLEAEQAGRRIRTTDDADTLTACDWVALAHPHADLAGMIERDLPPRAVLSVPPAHLDRATLLAVRPQRVVGVRLHGDTATVTDSEVSPSVEGWLALVGVKTTATEVAAVPALV